MRGLDEANAAAPLVCLSAGASEVIFPGAKLCSNIPLCIHVGWQPESCRCLLHQLLRSVEKVCCASRAIFAFACDCSVTTSAEAEGKIEHPLTNYFVGGERVQLANIILETEISQHKNRLDRCD